MISVFISRPTQAKQKRQTIKPRDLDVHWTDIRSWFTSGSCSRRGVGTECSPPRYRVWGGGTGLCAFSRKMWNFILRNAKVLVHLYAREASHHAPL